MPAPRVLAISEIPTPYRLPVYARLAARRDFDFEVLFCAAEQPDRPWHIEEELARVPHRILRGRTVTFGRTGNRHLYEVNPDIIKELRERRPDVLVIGGYAVFAEQLAFAYAQLHRLPYIIHSESHLLRTRRRSVRALKRLALPPIIGGAAAGLATGSAAAQYLVEYGLSPGRVRLFPNTIDVAEYGRLADVVRRDGDRIRSARNLPARFYLYAGRLAPIKGVPELASALTLLGARAPKVVVAGEGPLADELGSIPAVTMVGFQQRDRLIELLALAEATVVPSRSESWGVIVNEALACGCPVIASDAVGAVGDLLRDGVNGRIFPAGDAAALARVLDAPVPRGDGVVGRISRWDYDFAVDQFVEAVKLALPGRLCASA
jgi:glycosyltransferase involved in cell wall biosynthesis